MSYKALYRILFVMAMLVGFILLQGYDLLPFKEQHIILPILLIAFLFGWCKIIVIWLIFKWFVGLACESNDLDNSDNTKNT